MDQKLHGLHGVDKLHRIDKLHMLHIQQHLTAHLHIQHICIYSTFAYTAHLHIQHIYTYSTFTHTAHLHIQHIYTYSTFTYTAHLHIQHIYIPYSSNRQRLMSTTKSGRQQRTCDVWYIIRKDNGGNGTKIAI